MFKYLTIGIFFVILALPLTGCSSDILNALQQPQKAVEQEKEAGKPAPENNADKNTETPVKNTESAAQPEKVPPAPKQENTTPPPTLNQGTGKKTDPGLKLEENKPAKKEEESIPVVANPASIQVLVNKQNKLPDSYNPTDLVYTQVPFVFKEQSDKRKMRSEAATAINTLFTEANKQGISLLGVSAYRSHATQVSLFNYYVNRDGYEKARTYSALPGTSEHETGLTIDVTGGDGKCAAMDCFGATKEAIWLEAHAAEYGFIIRYPKGKEAITGYQYEPWHLRYVGKAMALEIMSKGITLEEYLNAIPVNN
ncbi:M15 family metallopeptidase [Neobacillus sp. FSL H8-0543]|uniref:M15 family metallopeptidase n=1 Tax=Neobacillus sp. FSL H8-0543 TaxID=2954672 RepID=UPI0031580135